MAAPTGVRVDLGSTDSVAPDCTHGLDIVPNPALKNLIVADLTKPWPFHDGGVDHFRAHDIIEHLADKIHTMNEAWRSLRHGGTIEIVVPTTEGSGAWQDPTHVSFWNRRSFLYFETGNPYRERFARHYGIKAKFQVLSDKTEHTMDGPKLTITLMAVKA